MGETGSSPSALHDVRRGACWSAQNAPAAAAEEAAEASAAAPQALTSDKRSRASSSGAKAAQRSTAPIHQQRLCTPDGPRRPRTPTTRSSAIARCSRPDGVTNTSGVPGMGCTDDMAQPAFNDEKNIKTGGGRWTATTLPRSHATNADCYAASSSERRWPPPTRRAQRRWQSSGQFLNAAMVLEEVTAPEIYLCNERVLQRPRFSYADRNRAQGFRI